MENSLLKAQIDRILPAFFGYVSRQVQPGIQAEQIVRLAVKEFSSNPKTCTDAQLFTELLFLAKRQLSGNNQNGTADKEVLNRLLTRKSTTTKKIGLSLSPSPQVNFLSVA